jgi:hypothetical protein
MIKEPPSLLGNVEKTYNHKHLILTAFNAFRLKKQAAIGHLWEYGRSCHSQAD